MQLTSDVSLYSLEQERSKLILSKQLTIKTNNFALNPACPSLVLGILLFYIKMIRLMAHMELQLVTHQYTVLLAFLVLSSSTYLFTAGVEGFCDSS
jgi:hypothetical protein